uniref:Calponin-homology (CH) domain-containing protein n=1 Tax=Hippocampus comes TaxID=109280 RepID=A0A3Q3DXP5_HIPCM
MSNNYGEEPQYYQAADFGGGEEEDEVPATEKDLAEDAPWKKIQQNTFTRWCNEHLKCVNKTIGDLQRDFSDGLKLIWLLEVLSQKKMYRKYHSRPNFRQMKLENVSVALEFLDRERIKLVSIGEWLFYRERSADALNAGGGAGGLSVLPCPSNLRDCTAGPSDVIHVYSK